jgi:hypothetical protein
MIYERGLQTQAEHELVAQTLSQQTTDAPWRET